MARKFVTFSLCDFCNETIGPEEQILQNKLSHMCHICGKVVCQKCKLYLRDGILLCYEHFNESAIKWLIAKKVIDQL